MSERRHRRRSAPRMAALCALAAVAAAPAAGQDKAEVGRYFALPLAREARTLAERAWDHLEAQRWSEGIVMLQRLIDEHQAEVLPDSYRETADQHSDHPAHPVE